MDRILLKQCPNLTPESYGAESPKSAFYNCIAYAAGVTNRWWQPPSLRREGPIPRYYWPLNAPDEYSVDAYVKAFESIGYAECQDSALEAGFEKIAVYNDVADPFQFHAARQLQTGWWVSKFGRGKDLEHKTAECIEHWRHYKLQKLMKRPLA